MKSSCVGGRYDGILGIMAGLEGLRTMEEVGVMTEYPVALVNWTNEEGARFPKSLHGSAVWSGQLPLSDAYAMRDVADSTITAGSELDRIGYKGTLGASHEVTPLAAHFELHIGMSYYWRSTQISGAQTRRTRTHPSKCESQNRRCIRRPSVQVVPNNNPRSGFPRGDDTSFASIGPFITRFALYSPFQRHCSIA